MSKANAAAADMNATAAPAVVFDMDGVIFDTEILVIGCWQQAAEEYGLGDVEPFARSIIGLTVKASSERYLAAYGESPSYEEVSGRARTIFRERYWGSALPLKPGVREILTWLGEQGAPVALASSTYRDAVVKELTDAEIIDHFSVIVCGDMITKSKPDPEIFLKACELLGADPREAYAIEDSYNGIRAAHAAGMHAIMVPDLLPPTEETGRLAEQTFPSLCEVKEFLAAQQRPSGKAI